MGFVTGTGPKGLDTFNTTPQTEADLNRLVALIAERGNARVDTTAVRNALTGAELYEGLLFYDTTIDALYVYNGSGWVLLASTELVETVSTFGTDITPNVSYPVKVYRDRNRVEVKGTVNFGATGSLLNLFTVSAPFRPANQQFVGFIGSQNTLKGELHIDAGTGKVYMPTAYLSGTIGAGQAIPIHGSWFLT